MQKFVCIFGLKLKQVCFKITIILCAFKKIVWVGKVKENVCLRVCLCVFVAIIGVVAVVWTQIWCKNY